jgi:hypothetical protein
MIVERECEEDESSFLPAILNVGIKIVYAAFNIVIDVVCGPRRSLQPG